MKKKLMLKKETLTELTSDKLRMVMGGGGDTDSCSCTSCGCSCKITSCNVITLTEDLTHFTANFIALDC